MRVCVSGNNVIGIAGSIIVMYTGSVMVLLTGSTTDGKHCLQV